MRLNKFFAGVTAGVILGVLFAPDKGCNTRRQLKRTCNDIKDQVDDWFGLEKDEIDELYEKLEDKASDITEDMRAKLIQLLDNAKQNIKQF